MKGPLWLHYSLASPPPPNHTHFLTWPWALRGNLLRSFFPVNGDKVCYKVINTKHRVRHRVSKDTQIALKDGLEHTLNKPDHDPAGVCQPHHTHLPGQLPLLYVPYLFLQPYILNTFTRQCSGLWGMAMDKQACISHEFLTPDPINSQRPQVLGIDVNSRKIKKNFPFHLMVI